MLDPDRGDVWLVDLGMVAEMRPCLIMSKPTTDITDRALVTLVAHTTSTRGSQFEVVVTVRFLKDGTFDTQNLMTVPRAKLVRRLGKLSSEQLGEVETVVRRWLGL